MTRNCAVLSCSLISQLVLTAPAFVQDSGPGIMGTPPPAVHTIQEVAHPRPLSPSRLARSRCCSSRRRQPIEPGVPIVRLGANKKGPQSGPFFVLASLMCESWNQIET